MAIPHEPHSFEELCKYVLGGQSHSDADEEKWIDEQGLRCPQLLEDLQKVYAQYKVVIFMTYYLTAQSLPLGFENSYLIPTVHDKPPVYLRYYDNSSVG